MLNYLCNSFPTKSAISLTISMKTLFMKIVATYVGWFWNVLVYPMKTKSLSFNIISMLWISGLICHWSLHRYFIQFCCLLWIWWGHVYKPCLWLAFITRAANNMLLINDLDWYRSSMYRCRCRLILCWSRYISLYKYV